MEVAGIDTVQTVKKVGQKSGVQETPVADTVSISSEAQKRADWVDQLKAMPDVRPEKIEEALSHPVPTFSALAQKILDSTI